VTNERESKYRLSKEENNLRAGGNQKFKKTAEINQEFPEGKLNSQYISSLL